MSSRYHIILVVLLLISVSGIGGTLIKVYEFRQPIISHSGNYSVIAFNETHLFGEPGKATLPFYPVKLLLPPGEIATSIDLVFENPAQIAGSFLLLPRQAPRPVSDTTNNIWYVDHDFYKRDQVYPSRMNLNVKNHFYRGHGIALSAFTPLRYNPSLSEVSYYQRVVVTVTTAPDPDYTDHQRNFFPPGSKASAVADLIQNPEMISTYYAGRDFPTNEYNYLIITQNQYLTEFDTLARFYKPRGIRTKIASTESISSTTAGDDLQEKIRNYIIEEYQQNGIAYVLLGGDVEIVPPRGFYCYVQSGSGYTDNNIPADLYYSALDGTWNTDEDGSWGEPGEEDLYPEVAVGRMPFSDTVELHNMLHKTMLYQSNPVQGELTQPLLAGEHLWDNPITWGSDYMKLLVGYRTDNGYTTRGIPESHPRDTLYDRYASWSKNTLMTHINAGRPWLHHCGHANQYYVMKLSNSDIINSNFSQANGINHNFTIVYTHGCTCGAFDYSDCIGERMVAIDNFAVAFIGNSRYGWFVEGTTDGPSQHLHREFIDALYRDSLYHIGMAHMKSKAETAPFVDLEGEYEFGATRWCFYDNNVLGDPMMAMWTEEPGTISITYPSLIPIGADSVSIQLNGLPGVYQNFTCSLYRNDTLFGTGISDSSGSALIYTAYDMAEGPVSLVVTGYNILLQYYEIQVSDYWLGLSADWNKAQNWATGQIPDSNTCIIIPANPVGSHFPVENTGEVRQCRAICIEPGALFNLKPDETFSVTGN